MEGPHLLVGSLELKCFHFWKLRSPCMPGPELRDHLPAHPPVAVGGQSNQRDREKNTHIRAARPGISSEMGNREVGEQGLIGGWMNLGSCERS